MKAHEIISQVLKAMAGMASEGVTVKDIDLMAEEMVLGLGGKPFNKGYHPVFAKTPYPASTCISVNNCIAHGIPNTHILKSGDLVNFDLSVIKDGECADSALSVGIGEISNKDRHLLKYAKRVLYAGIYEVKAGVSTKVIAEAIESEAMKRGFKVNRRFIGHGIGDKMHLEPKILHFVDEKFKYDTLKEGQIICIEPSITYSRDTLGIMDEDNWACYTGDGKNCAMYEHMVKVTKTGYEVLTTHIEDDDEIIIKS